MTEKFDVIICGAGPAGSTCALALGKSGLKVALIDKSSFPRDKICGDAVAAYVPKVLNTINPDYAQTIKSFTDKEVVHTMRIVTPNEKTHDVNFGEDGFISKRIHFDNFLFQQAAKLPNVKTFTNSSVKNITVNEKGVSVETINQLNLQAEIIIGCDGAQGISKKKLTGIPIDKKHYAGAVRAYFKNVKDIPAGTFELHFLKKMAPGYFWIFPLPNNEANVGIGLGSEDISKQKINLRDHMQECIRSIPYLKDRFSEAEIIGEIEGYGLPLGSKKISISGYRYMLCGDAASLIDPLTGEGIGQAIVSGRYAGWQAIKSLQEKNFSVDFMKKYDNDVYKKLWKSHRNNYWLRELIFKKPAVLNIAFNLITKNKFIFNLAKRLVI